MIIQPHLSIKYILLLTLLLSTNSFAQKKCKQDFKVLIKNKKSYSFETRDLEDLYCNGTFEGKHFKIVEDISDDAISFDSDKELIKRAANVYYHLTKARKYWTETLRTKYVKRMDQITIRINITRLYSKMRHFKHEGREANYNNAWSTYAGQTPKVAKEQKKWGREIWFNPMKKFESRKNMKSIGNNPIHQGLKLIQEPLVDIQGNAILYGGLGVIASPTTGTSYLNNSVERLAVIAGVYGITEASKYLDKAFTEKYYFMDTALVPDIIYHEFAHIALSDTMKTVHSVPVIEGMADYFAAQISEVQDNEMYKKIKNISSNRSKKLKNRKFYDPSLEYSWNATSDFTLSLLWNTRMNFNKENEKRLSKGKDILGNFDEIVYEAHFHLQEDSTILEDLTNALRKTCNRVCASKRLGLNVLHKSFEEKGLN